MAVVIAWPDLAVYLLEVLSTARLVRVNSLDELYHGLITQHTLPGRLQHGVANIASYLTQAGKQSWRNEGFRQALELASLWQEFEHSIWVVLCRS